jgi:hypothetical protein
MWGIRSHEFSVHTGPPCPVRLLGRLQCLPRKASLALLKGEETRRKMGGGRRQEIAFPLRWDHFRPGANTLYDILCAWRKLPRTSGCDFRRLLRGGFQVNMEASARPHTWHRNHWEGVVPINCRDRSLCTADARSVPPCPSMHDFRRLRHPLHVRNLRSRVKSVPERTALGAEKNRGLARRGRCPIVLHCAFADSDESGIGGSLLSATVFDWRRDRSSRPYRAD